MSAGGRKAGQLVVDWARMAGRISEEGRARFSQLRGRYEACKTRYTLSWRLTEPNVYPMTQKAKKLDRISLYPFYFFLI